MSILLQFQFVASRLVLDFSVRGRSGSHKVAVAAASASAALLRRCRRHWLHYYTELLGFVSFLFFLKVHSVRSWPIFANNKCQNLNWFIAVLRFFLEQTGSLIWSLSTDDCAVSDSSASAVEAAMKLQRLEVIKRSNWE